jgi:large subunit ribosomal protein L21
MYAIVEIAGQQFKVQEGQEIFVHHLGKPEGEKLSFDKVYLIDRGGQVSVGMPTLSNKVLATVLHPMVQGDKVIIFKKKRRKGYQLMKGHRQQFTKIKIDTIQ